MSAAPSPHNPIPAADDLTPDGKYKVGTLTYTVPGLFVMMLWLLWGDFCFYLMEAVVPSVLPVMMGNLDAPSWLIALCLTTIPGLLNATVCPFVSFWSDRYRSPLGRRIPFIYYTIPFLCLSLGLIGVAPMIADWLVQSGLVSDTRLVALGLIGVFTASFQFFNMFVASVYYYLFNDVVPARFLGRFLAIFRIIGILAGSAFSFFVFPKAETHYPEIFVGAALLYGVVFFFMCRNVREGKYPPPPMKVGHSVWGGVRTFFQECYTKSFYWFFYLSVALWAASLAWGVFGVFFAKAVGLSLSQLGVISGVSAIVSAGLLFPCGFLGDKFHPIRTMLAAVVAQAVLSALPLVFLIFRVSPDAAFQVWCIVFGVSVPVMALFLASELPTYMKILPHEKFGQFASAAALVRSLFTMGAGLILGLLIDWTKTMLNDPNTAYLFLPIWPTVLQAMSAFCLWMCFLQWKRLGGDTAYSPP